MEKKMNTKLMSVAMPFALLSFFAPSAIFALSESDFTTSLHGTEVYNDSDESISITGTKDTLKEFSYNWAVNSDNPYYVSLNGISVAYDTTNDAFEAAGGAIYNRETISSIDYTDFTYNLASFAGGAIFNGIDNIYGVFYDGNDIDGGYIGTISNSKFTSNYAYYAGGAILNFLSTINEITYTDFTSNASSTIGGAIANYGGYIATISNSTFTENVILDDVSYAGGGAIYNNGTISTITESSFIDNSTGTTKFASGGAIANEGTITLIEDSYFSDNYSYLRGGAIWNEGTSSYIGEITGSTFYKNITSGEGGAIFNGNGTGTQLTIISDSVFSYNEANTGGAIMNYCTTLGTITGTEFSNNIANSGGAIYNYFEGSTIDSIIDSTFSSNKATNSEGGAIYNDSGAIINTISGSTFDSNSATSYGGAIFNDGYSGGYIGTISNSSFVNNTVAGTDYSSSSKGGAIYNEGTIDVIDNVYFTSNSSGYIAGAIYNFEEIGIISNSVFDSNYVNVSDPNTHSSIVTAGAGGAIVNEGSDIIEIKNSVFTNNYVTVSAEDFSQSVKGGALYTTVGFTFSSTEGNDILNIGNYASIDSTVDSDDDANGGFLYSDNAKITFATEAKSSISIGDGTAGYDSIAGEGTITKTGAGELIVNSSMQFYEGSLDVKGGTMTVNNILGATSITIDEGATLSMGITTASLIGEGLSSVAVFSSSSSSDFSFSNSGTLSLVASVGLADNSTYTVFANGSVDITNITTFGGTYNSTTGIFSVSAAENLVLNTSNATVTVAANDRVAVSTTITTGDGDTEETTYTAVYLAFSSDATSTNTTDTSVISVASVTDISTIGNQVLNTSFIAQYTSDIETSGETYLASAAYDFDIDLASGSVLLSMYVGVEDYDVSQFTIYHSSDGEDWDTTSVSNVTYDGEYVSFEVTGFSTYGYTVTASAAVPEPSTYAMIIGVLALAFAAYRRRK